MTREINTNDLKGKEVIGPQGGLIGKVSGLNFDPETWVISTLQVNLDSKVAEEIGIKKRLQRVGISHTEIPLKASFVGQIGDRVLVTASRDELVKYVTEVRIDETTKQIHLPGE
jgi:sporulation protein YlmC with PRC-barrel domain